MDFKKVFLVSALVAIMGVSAMAQDASVTPYAGVRYFIGAYYQNKDMAKANGTGSDADVDLANTLVNTSRVGVKFNKGKLSGVAELGLGPGHAGKVTTRHIYANYKFDMGLNLLVGQTDLPWYMPLTNEAYDIHGGPGTSQADRTPQIKLSYMGAYLVLAKSPGLNPPDSNLGYHAQMYAGQDVYMPLTAIGYDYKSDMIDLGVGFAGYKYFIKNPTLANAKENDDIFAFIGYVHGNVKLGDLFVRFNVAIEQAPTLLGLTQAGPHFNGAGSASTIHNGITSDLKKLDDMFVEGMLELGFKLPFGVFAVSGGYAMNLDETDATRLGIGAQLAINVAPGFSIVPTVFYLDEMKNSAGNKQGADALAGLQFRADL